MIYDSTWPRSALLQRGDITVIGVPLAKLVNENFDGVRNRILLKNIAYAGVLAALLDIDLAVISAIAAAKATARSRSCSTRTPGRCAWATTTPRQNLTSPAAAARRTHG